MVGVVKHEPRRLWPWLIFDVRQKMDAGIQHAAEFLAIIKEALGRLDDFAYSLVLRFNAVKRRHADAHMVNGGYFCIACSFAVDAVEKRWLLWGISIEWTASEWFVRATAEEEDDFSGTTLWESERFRAVTLDEFAASLKKAHGAIEGSLAVPRIAEIFESWRMNQHA